MTLQEQKSALILYLKMKTEQSDWHGVSDAANDLREIEIKLKYESKPEPKQMELPLEQINKHNDHVPNIPSKPATNASEIPPTEVVIPHHMGKVASLIRMGDEELLDNLFPLPKGVEA